jgi:hypothetical protein
VTKPDQSPEPKRSDLRSIGGEASRSIGGEASFESSASKPSAGANRAPARARDKTPWRGVPVWLFVVVLVLFAVAVGWQLRVAGELRQEIADLETNLARTSALLGAHQNRLSEIRGGVYELVDRVEGLRALVDAEPRASASPPLLDSSGPAADSRPRIPPRLPTSRE